MAMNEIDQKLHAAIHQDMMSIPPDQIFSSRVNVFGQVERRLGFSIGGRVLDMGCGSGYASIWLAKNRAVAKVYALEASVEAVQELLPRNINHHNVAGKVEPLLGSFEAIPVNDLDFVVSFGALHHSPCLFSTMNSVGSSLRNGAYFVAQEPVMPNTTGNQAFINKYDVIEDRYGLKIRNGDRQDCFFREAEYIAAAAFSGLDLVYYDDYKVTTPLIIQAKQWIKKLLLSITKKEPPPSRKTNRLAEHTMAVMPKIMVFKKNETSYIPHMWKPLKQSASKGE